MDLGAEMGGRGLGFLERVGARGLDMRAAEGGWEVEGSRVGM